MADNFEYQLTYAEFKEIALKKKAFWQHIPRTKYYEIFIVDGKVKYNSVVWRTTEGVGGIDAVLEAANLVDYEANYLPDSNRPMDISPTAAQSQFYGRTIYMEAGATSGYCEWSFEADTYLSKVLPQSIDAVKGDYVEFEVWAKAGIVGPAPVKVGQYAFTIPMYGSRTMPWIYGSGGGLIKSYFTVRCYYYKEAGVARDFNVIAEFQV